MGQSGYREGSNLNEFAICAWRDRRALFGNNQMLMQTVILGK